MLLSSVKIKAYATLVRAKLYILSEEDRENAEQTPVPSDYVAAVATYLIEH